MLKWINWAVIGFALLLSACGTPASDDAKVQILGRYVTTDSGGYTMGWPASGVAVRFRGTKMVVTITDDGQGIMDAVINGTQSALILKPGTKDYTIVSDDTVSGETASVYDVALTRRTEAHDTGLFTIENVSVEGEILPRPVPAHKILFIGDSITAGYGLRGNTRDCNYSPSSNAPLKTYAGLSAQALDARMHLIAISGRGVVNNYGDNPKPVMPRQMDNALPDTNGADVERDKWEYGKFRPEVVVVALGTNDASSANFNAAQFKSGYLDFARDVRARFPSAHIVLASGPIMYSETGSAVVAGIDYARAELQDTKVTRLHFTLSESQLKWSCNGHPGRDSQAQMARDLSAHIAGFTGWKPAKITQRQDLKINPPEGMKAGGKAHYKARVAEIAKRAPLEGGVLFLGDSITEGGDWAALFPKIKTANHGIGWDIVSGVGGRLPQIIINNPDKIFIMIGTNDIGYGHDPVDMAAELEDVIKVLRYSRQSAQIYLQSVLPRELENVSAVAAINAEYKKLAQDMDVEFVDLTAAFSAPDGALKASLTEDSLHLNAKGYGLWASEIRGLVEQ